MSLILQMTKLRLGDLVANCVGILSHLVTKLMLALLFHSLYMKNIFKLNQSFKGK